MTSTLPRPHKTVLESVRSAVEADPRFLGLLAGGSYLHGGFDAHSDLDLVLVCRPEAYADCMDTRRAFASAIGNLLAAFTGEHVGEPRLLICLYGPDVIHVDLKFVMPPDLEALIERPAIIWSRGPEIEAAIASAHVSWPNHPADWFEERIWIWLHYGATKLARGELYETIGMLGFIREQVLGPLLSLQEGRDQRGVRRLEQLSPAGAEALTATLATHERNEVLLALRETVHLYESWRPADTPVSPASEPVKAFIETL